MAKNHGEPLSNDNFDTLKLQIEALLINADGWPYVGGSCLKPEPVAGVTNSQAATAWITANRKARADTILYISPSELNNE